MKHTERIWPARFSLLILVPLRFLMLPVEVLVLFVVAYLGEIWAFGHWVASVWRGETRDIPPPSLARLESPHREADRIAYVFEISRDRRFGHIHEVIRTEARSYRVGQDGKLQRREGPDTVRQSTMVSDQLAAHYKEGSRRVAEIVYRDVRSLAEKVIREEFRAQLQA